MYIYKVIKTFYMRFVRGSARFQQSFLSLDDKIGQDNVVRIIDEVCNAFIVSGLCLVDKGKKMTGRKAYHPGDLLKLFVYGYFNGVSSSRKLERECLRNIELQWLMEGLAPDHKTISDFRKNNPDLIRGLFLFLTRSFKEQGLATGRCIAVDGTKIKAYAYKEYRLDHLKKKLENIENQAAKYMEDLAAIDEAEDSVEELETRKQKLTEELEELERKKKAYSGRVNELESEGLKRKCTTDPDARTMKARYGTFLGYNLQIAVDVDSHFVTEYQLVNGQNDKGLLAPMVEGSAEVMGQTPEEVQADAGYYKKKEVETLEEEGVECFVAVNDTTSRIQDEINGLKFIYNSEEDNYQCSGGRTLDYYRKKTENGEEKRIYKSKDCSGCPFLNVCTKQGSHLRARTYTRNSNQEWLDRYKEKMMSEKGKKKLRQRKAVAEHPFGTMKYYMGQMPTVLRGRKNVSSEMGLYTIAYNLRRYMAILGQNSRQNPAVLAKSCSNFILLFNN
jgi:transposase